MKFADLLSSKAVKAVTTASSKKRVMHSIAEVAESAYGIPAQHAVEALLEREGLGPTGVGHGVALPHARLDKVEKVAGVFILLEKPIDFEAVDRQPVDVIFALFAPEDAGVEHLKALALVSRTLRDQTFCTKLRSNPDPSTLYTIITEAAAVQAA